MSIYFNMLNQLSDSSIDKSTRNKLKFVVGELQRVSKEKDKSVSDDIATKVFKKLVKNCKETISLCDDSYIEEKKGTEELIEFVNEYLPDEITEDEIKNFISSLDLSKYKNKMQAIGVVMKEFNGNVDGNLVRKIISEL